MPKNSVKFVGYFTSVHFFVASHNTASFKHLIGALEYANKHCSKGPPYLAENPNIAPILTIHLETIMPLTWKR